MLSLSKLNWNNTQCDGGEPITVRAARRVGDILKHAEWLHTNTNCDWTFDNESNTRVQRVHDGDPRSTFFRYPTTNLAADVDKSAMQEFTPEDLEELFARPAEDQKKVFAMIVENDDKEFVRGYMDREGTTTRVARDRSPGAVSRAPKTKAQAAE